MFISTLNRARDGRCLSSLAWLSVSALLQLGATLLFLSWVHFPLSVSFFWSVWHHCDVTWQHLFFLDFSRVKYWKTLRVKLGDGWWHLKTKHRKGSWALAFFFFPPRAAPWMQPGVTSCELMKPPWLREETEAPHLTQLSLAQKYLSSFTAGCEMRFCGVEQVTCNIRTVILNTGPRLEDQAG